MSHRDDRRRRDRSREAESRPRDRGRRDGSRDRDWDRRDRDRERYPRRNESPPRDSRGYRSRSRSPRRGDNRDRYARHDRDLPHGNGDYRKRDTELTRGRGDPNPSRDRNRDDRDRLPEVKSELERTGKRTGREQETSSKAEAPAGPTDQGDDIEEGEDADQMDGLDEVDENIAAMMGFSGFGSTKDKEVEGNQGGSVLVKKRRTWRQYMNRRGGFNRPLDKIK